VILLRASRNVVAAVLLAAALAGCGCAPRPRPAATALEVDVFSDTSGAVPFRIVPPPAARVWLRGVAIARPAQVDAPLPSAEPAAAPPDTSAPPALPIDPSLKSPILRGAGRMVLPASRGRAARVEAVELDVQVSEAGDVTDARWAGGSADSALVAAATACARSMTFHPALLGGRPVSVWCRQRFEFSAR
jgi:TonB family protein